MSQLYSRNSIPFYGNLRNKKRSSCLPIETMAENAKEDKHFIDCFQDSCKKKKKSKL